MLENIKKYKVILASASPRRRELLAGLDIDFEVRTLPDVDESFPATLQGGDIPLFISKKKADAYLSLMSDEELVITADTIVWLDGKALGKPVDAADARLMLRGLSGKTHSEESAQGCIPKRLPGRPDEALGGGKQGPSAPAWARQHHRQRDPPFVPRKRLPDWASPELCCRAETCGCVLGP